MDLSDGLSTDLDRMVRASGVGARIMLEHLPVPARTPLLDRLGLDPVELALHGGEDYELLFTVPPRHIHRLPRRLHGVALHEIGEVTAGNAIELVRANRPAGRLEPRGWDPFRRR
jgi:thiamine-monophosphate kinase